jgi:hypothetical protein
VISVVDPQARHTRKSSSSRRDGYRAHVAADPETGIITGEKLTMASGDENSDAAVAAEFAAAEAAAGQDGPLSWYGDSAYGTGELRAAITAAGQRAVIKPKPLLPAVPGGFTTDDFAAGPAAGTVTCPAGITWQVTPRRCVIFGAACRDCPLRQRSTTAKDGRTVNLHRHDQLLRAARAEWPGLREDYKAHRPNIERVSAARRRPSRYAHRPVVTSSAPNTVTCRFLPGVRTCGRLPRRVQLARMCGSRCRWVSSGQHHVAGKAGPAEQAGRLAGLGDFLLNFGLGQVELLPHQQRQVLCHLADHVL